MALFIYLFIIITGKAPQLIILGKKEIITIYVIAIKLNVILKDGKVFHSLIVLGKKLLMYEDVRM